MRKVIVVLAAALIASTALAGTNLVRSHLTAGTSRSMKVDIAGLSARLTALYGADAGSAYLGSDVCLACHNGAIAPDETGWHNTRHSQFLRRPMGEWTLVDGKGVIANQAHGTKDDFMMGVDLATVGSFSAYGANAPKLSYDAGTDTYWMQIGALKCQVVATQAGSAGQDTQRFLLRVPVTDTDTKLSKALYFAPVTYSRTQGWMPASPTGGGWYSSSLTPKFDTTLTSSALVAAGGPTSHTAYCVGCHVTGIRSLGKTATGEATYQGYYATLYSADDPDYFDYNGDGNFEIVNIGCEACHGPGAQHVLGGGDPTKIVNPAKLTGAQSSEICGRCHIAVRSAPNKTYGWPFDDANGVNWIPRYDTWVPLATDYVANYSYWGDGKLPSGHLNAYDQYQLSAHAATHYGQNGSSEPCSACHDAMDKQQEYQINTSITDESSGLEIPTSVDNDSLCLACHATHGPFANITKAQVADYANNEDAIAKVVSAHSNHPFAPERIMGLSRCVECHMSPSAGHTWWVTKPEDTLTYMTSGVKDANGNYVGYPNACADSCHNTRVNIFGLGLDPTPTSWTKPYDKSLASILVTYYGPGGTWWNTTPTP